MAFSPTGRQIAVGGSLITIASLSEISAGEKDEQSAVARVAERKREHAETLNQQRLARSGDEGAIKKWLLLAPISMAAGQNGRTALLHDFIQAESRLRPHSGDSVSIQGHPLAWKPIHQDDYVFDFNAILGRNTPNSVLYGVCYIQSEITQADLRILVGSDDQSTPAMITPPGFGRRPHPNKSPTGKRENKSCGNFQRVDKSLIEEVPDFVSKSEEILCRAGWLAAV